MKSLSIIVPCYNAEESIAKSVVLLIKKLKKIKIINEIILINEKLTKLTTK